MKLWLFPINLKYYNVVAVVNNEKHIYWPLKNKLQLDDLIYVYATIPYKKILFRLRVVELNTPEKLPLAQFEHYSDPFYGVKKKWGKFATLVLEKVYDDSNYITLEDIRKNGLKSSLMGPKCISNNPELLKWFQKYDKR